ncbi:unnamed protein product [Effrenium voratum]|uniref:Uncharacterized protein n=1 Tax=Effrenium voratum TaxID=2562239 RepID=A0AA36JJZ3_9DINO|nr:unnamed protein product [Effrenium voratum]
MSRGGEFVKDMVHMHSFLAAQKRILSAECFTNMLEAQAMSFGKRLDTLSGSISCGHCLHRSAAQTPARRPLQCLHGFANYLTEAEIGILQDQTTHDSVKLQCLVNRCVALGLHLPAEGTVKHIIASACDLQGLSAANADAKFRALQEFKVQLKARIKHMQRLPMDLHLAKYPADPNDLPQELYSAAYGYLAFA